MIGLTIFLFGLIIGSFLNVCIYRIPRNESIAFPPSHCTNCGKEIKWYDLFPVVSYLLIKGKCRFCREKISMKYPVIELITGVLFTALYIEYNITFNFFKYIVLAAFLLVIAIIDFETTDVYLKTTLSGIIAGIVFILLGVYFNISFLQFLLGGIIGGGVISLIVLLTGGMGWGDAEICLLCGLYLGWQNTLLMLFLSFVIGGVAGILLIALKIKSRKDYIPFGPFIAISSIICAFLGSSIINWYLTKLNLF